MVITKNLRNQINRLHKKVGSFEWSGELITREEGIITDLEDWTVFGEEIYLVDIGTSGYTSYESERGAFKSTDIVELYEKFPGLITGEQKAHHIHTHHGMGAFFSSTDWDNLEERALLSNYFIMLIVDFKGDYKAKVAFKANVGGAGKKVVSFANNGDEYAPITFGKEADKEYLVVMDMKIEMEEVEPEPSDWFDERYNNVKTAVESDKTTLAAPYYGNGNGRSYRDFHRQGSFNWEKDKEDDKVWKPINTTNKRVSEMTDEEWEETQVETDRNLTVYEANCIINGVLKDDPTIKDGTSPLIDMKKQSDKMPYHSVKALAETLMPTLSIHLEQRYMGCSDEFYLGALKFISDNVLEAPKYNALARELNNLIKKEIKKLDSTLITQRWEPK
jgi:hypothetical protein